MLEDGQRNSCIPLRNILNSYTQQPAGVSRFFSQLFCIANTTSLEDAFPVTQRGEGAGAAERRLFDHLSRQHEGAREGGKLIGGARSHNAKVLEYAGGRPHRRVGC